MKYGLSVNANETVKEIVEKCIELEKLGFDYVWVADLPAQRYSPIIASAIAEKTNKIKIGLGLLSPFLHTSNQIASSLITLVEFYGNRFELCIGPGDKDQLRRAGIFISKFRDLIPEFLLKSKKIIIKEFNKKGIKIPIWLGAQGINILKLSKFFDGVLLNYANPSLIKWALKEMNLSNKNSIQIGIYTPSYVYFNKKSEDLCTLLRVSSLIVASGASKTVLKRLGLYSKVSSIRKKLIKGLTPEDVLNEFPIEMAKEFSIFMNSNRLNDYILELKSLGINHIVFGYPQNFSLSTIKDLANALFKNR